MFCPRSLPDCTNLSVVPYVMSFCLDSLLKQVTDCTSLLQGSIFYCATMRAEKFYLGVCSKDNKHSEALCKRYSNHHQEVIR